MSRNFIEIEGNALNLSLNGSSMNHSSKTLTTNRQINSKKPPASSQSLTNRSSLSSRSNSTLSLEQVKNKETTKLQPKPKLPLAKKSIDKKNSLKESNIFQPLSVRSSADDLDLTLKTQTDFSTTSSGRDALELFFGKKSADSSNSNKFDVIDPLKDDKITKLQSSVDNLRKELQKDTDLNAKENTLMNRLHNTKRKLAAIKIQTWYRKKLARKHSNQLDEIEKLFSRKKSELEKKLNEKSPPKNKNLLKSSQILNATNHKSNVKVNNSTNKDSPRLLKFNNLNQTDSQSSSNEQIKPITKTDTARKPANANTVEGLFLSLDKIEKESVDLLKLDNSNKSAKLDDLLSETINDEKVNSILSFLDEASSNDANNFVPKAFKDYNIDFNQYYSNLEAKKASNDAVAQATSRQKAALTNRKTESEVPKKLKQETPKPSVINSSISVKQPASKQKQQQQIQNELDDSIYSKEIELNDQILTVKGELEEKKRTIAMLEKALSQQKELTIRHTQEADKEMQIRLEVQKNDYEATIQRHLGFIDQLIDDKKNLSEKCEKLVKELKDVEKTYSDKFRTAEERYKIDTKKLKETFEVAEKLRREKWIEEKTKQIKDMTVKGLQPELQALINKHKNEIKTIKTMHEAELLQADERAAQKYIRITEELRENYEREKEVTIQKEREIFKQRYEKSLEDEEKSFLEQRRRLYAEIEEEKNRIAEQGAAQRKELDRLRKMLEENNLNTIETIRKEYQAAQAEADAKHQLEVKNLKEKLGIEKTSWEENYLKKQENWVIQKERELKEQVKRERDKEIELLITRLEAESTSAREEADRAAENRIKRIRDKYESELREVEKTERDTMERYNSLKAKYNEIEGEYERLKVMVKQKEKDIEGIKKLTDTLQEERNRLADVIRQEFSDRLIFTEEENKRIKLDMVEIKSRHQYEIEKKKEEFEKLQKEKADELSKLEEKVKQVIAKKDEVIGQITKQYESACKRVEHLEGLLEQSRALMLKKQANNT